MCALKKGRAVDECAGDAVAAAARDVGDAVGHPFGTRVINDEVWTIRLNVPSIVTREASAPGAGEVNWPLVLAKAVARLYLVADSNRDPLLASIPLTPGMAPPRESAVNGLPLAAPLRAGASGSAPAHRPLDGLAVLRTDPRQAVKEDNIRCLICGRVFRQLTNTHLRAHKTRASEYKRRFGYNRGRPLMCRALQRLYVDRAVRFGLAAKIRRRPILAEPELRRVGGSRAIALEELLTRREARRRAPAQNGVGG